MKQLRWQILIVIVALGAIAILLFSQKPVVTETIYEDPEPVAGGTYIEALIGKGYAVKIYDKDANLAKVEVVSGADGLVAVDGLIFNRHDEYAIGFIQTQRFLTGKGYAGCRDVYCFAFDHALIGKYSDRPLDFNALMGALFNKIIQIFVSSAEESVFSTFEFQAEAKKTILAIFVNKLVY